MPKWMYDPKMLAIVLLAFGCAVAYGLGTFYTNPIVTDAIQTISGE